MRQWKDAKGRRLGGFGSITKSCRNATTGFQPSFGPSYDCPSASYQDSISAMHERARLRQRMQQSPGLSYHGSDEMHEDLEQNYHLLQELQLWQDHRTRCGDENPGERESLVGRSKFRPTLTLADELFASLTRLAAGTKPSDFVKLSPGTAHTLARRIALPAPTIRGTLDPRRPHALHDNLTVRPRSQTRYAPYAAQTRTYTAPPSALRQSFGP
jgi:hypothetical protein